MEEVKKIRTACRSCHGGCGVIAHDPSNPRPLGSSTPRTLFHS